MVKFLFNKLIREKLIDKMLDAGVQVESTRLTQNLFINSLKAKLIEEVEEVVNSKNTEELEEELADVLEVIYSLCSIYNIDFKEIENFRQYKLEQKGGFTENSFVYNVSFSENESKMQSYAEYYRAQPKKYPEITD